MKNRHLFSALFIVVAITLNYFTVNEQIFWTNLISKIFKIKNKVKIF
jgi:hypothetical protein